MHLIALHDTAGSDFLGPKFLYTKFASLKSRLAFILPNFKPASRIGFGTAPHSIPLLFSKSPVNGRRSYSQVAVTITDPKNKLFKLDGYFITGFADAEGSFMVLVQPDKKLKLGWSVKIRFQISLHEKDLVLLESIKSYFGGIGSLTQHGKGSIQYRVSSLRDITNVIIPHFLKFPLITKKKADFILFQMVVELVSCKKHLTKEGLEKIISIKGSINLGLPSELKAAFPNIITLVERPEISNMVIQSPYWLAGFTSGEGSFMIKIKKASTYIVGYQTLLEFELAQHSRDFALMESIISYLNCGVVAVYDQIVFFRVSKFSDIKDKIIPIFLKYPVLGVKSLDFANFCRVASLINSKDHLTSAGFHEILKIKQNRISSAELTEDNNSLVETQGSGSEGDSFIKSNSTQEGLLLHCSRRGKKVKGLTCQSVSKRRFSFKSYVQNSTNRFSFIGINVPSLFKRTFLVNVKPKSRIGPHNLDVISVLVGSLLGDGHAERLKTGGVKFIFRQQAKHKEYLFYLYEFFNKRGYCTNNLPVLYKQTYGIKVYEAYRFNTYTFSSWMWLYKLFYTNSKVKVIPNNISELLTPLALAIWIMDDGTWKNPGVRIATNCFTKEEVELLKLTLETKFNLKSSLHKNNGKYQLYIKQESIPLLRELVLSYFVPSMLYKLGL